MTTPRTIKVFIASPGGLEEARSEFKKITEELNDGFGAGCDVVFEPLGWEDTISATGVRTQSDINKDVDACEVFLLVMDQLPGRKNTRATIHAVKSLPKLGKLWPTNTLEEFSLAMSRFERSKLPKVFPILRNIPIDRMNDPGTKCKQVINLRKMLVASGMSMLYPWSTIEEFRAHVIKILRNYAKPPTASGEGDDLHDGGTPAMLDPRPPAPSPEFIAEHEATKQELARIREEKAKLEEELKAARSRDRKRGVKPSKVARALSTRAAEEGAVRLERLQSNVDALALAERAANAALEGRVEEARQDFAKALERTTNLRVLYLGFEFFNRIGELGEAERLLNRWLSVSGPENTTDDTADAYGNLGVIAETRGHLGAAEAYHKKSLAINQKLGRQEGVAGDYGNLGLVERARGNLEAAETYHKKALAINEKLGRLEGMASDYGNLGLVERARGDLDSAEAHHQKSLAINERLGRRDGVADQYGNLGAIEWIRGNLDAAEAYLKKSLAINEKLGRLEGMSNQYGNLGLIEHARKNPSAADAYIRKSLAIDERLGRREGRATAFANIGLIEKTRGNIDEARRYLTLARDLFREIGAKAKEARVQEYLDALG